MCMDFNYLCNFRIEKWYRNHVHIPTKPFSCQRFNTALLSFKNYPQVLDYINQLGNQLVSMSDVTAASTETLNLLAKIRDSQLQNMNLGPLEEQLNASVITPDLASLKADIADLASEASVNNPDSKVHGVNMGPTWGRQDPGGPHVGLMDLAIWDAVLVVQVRYTHGRHLPLRCLPL